MEKKLKLQNNVEFLNCETSFYTYDYGYMSTGLNINHIK